MNEATKTLSYSCTALCSQARQLVAYAAKPRAVVLDFTVLVGQCHKHPIHLPNLRYTLFVQGSVLTFVSSGIIFNARGKPQHTSALLLPPDKCGITQDVKVLHFKSVKQQHKAQ